MQYASDQFARGDDHNQHAPIKEYAIVNLNTRYAVTKQLELFAVARNVFDDKYETFGVMNRNCFNDGQPQRFPGPGAPIAG
ncbi:MAG TPA: TonB-dependent receptor [Methylococcaceae bacterium]|nr:TonB-dependent receptor [Methylococcaceae bacterium]